MQHGAVFVSTMTAKLLTYALGRGLEDTDGPAVRDIMRSAAPSRYSFSSIVLAIVKGVPFQMRSASPQTREAAELAQPAAPVLAVAHRQP